MGVTLPGSSEAGPGVLFTALHLRSMNTPAPVPHGDDLAHIALTEDLQNLSMNHVRDRFQGNSSGAMLFKDAVRRREGYEEKSVPWTSRRMHYWTYNPAKNRVPHVGPFVFPEPDLLSALVELYFVHKNLYYPVLHRPTFDRSLADGLHIRDPAFGAVVLLVCAIGSRYSDDPRVSLREAEPLRCGWEFFDQLPFHFDHIFSGPSVYHLQYYCLAAGFLQWCAPPPCWTLVGMGLRFAQDHGVHRQQQLGAHPTTESELWKRGFWVLVSYDRQLSLALGRSCGIPDDDIDTELPIECDDEFWEPEDPAQAFVQPVGKPSRIGFFNCYLRLNNILSLALKTLYTLNKTKTLLTHLDARWEEHLVAELDSALIRWLDSIPVHLRWDPNRRDNAFFDQSALLYCSYYRVQICIHRPFVHSVRNVAPTSLPSLAICTNAARSCSHVVDISRLRKNGVPAPVLLSSAFYSGMILLFNIWSSKCTGLPPHMNSAITEVHKCMATISVCEKRWQTAGLFYDLLHELATISPLPLPKEPSPPVPDQAPPNPNKRQREDDTVQYPRALATPVQYPPYGNTYHPLLTGITTPAVDAAQTTQQFVGLPTHNADLGRLPVFPKHTAPPPESINSWYQAQSAVPLRHSDFAVGVDGTPPNDRNGTGGIANVFNSSSSLFFAPGAEAGHPIDMNMPNFAFGMAEDPTSNEIMAMWADAPTGFEVDDWAKYFSVMNDFNK
ncbi:fungal-specific transcription factor domain-containing protein [Mycena capillaripes]|nr:fungal-specific transcription factor domain-containing protein [Mycena capillaripes]